MTESPTWSIPPSTTTPTEGYAAAAGMYDPSTNAVPSNGASTPGTCNPNMHIFACRHELVCQCGCVMRQPHLMVSDGL